jgi:hypothetical protein
VPLDLPFRTPSTSTSVNCNEGELWGMDANYLYGCTAFNTLRRIPWQRF